MKTNYKAIDALVIDLEENREYHRQRANMNVGVISGWVSTVESGEEIERNINTLQSMIRTAIESGCNRKAMLHHLRDLEGDRFTHGFALELFEERDFLRSTQD